MSIEKDTCKNGASEDAFMILVALSPMLLDSKDEVMIELEGHG